MDAVLDHGDKLRFRYSDERYDSAKLDTDFAETLMDVANTVGVTQDISMEVIEQNARDRHLTDKEIEECRDKALHGRLNRENIRYRPPIYRDLIDFRYPRFSRISDVDVIKEKSWKSSGLPLKFACELTSNP